MAEIIIPVPDNKVDELKLGFLAKCPIPVDEEGTPLYTDIVWIRKWVIKTVFSEYVEGKKLLAVVEIDDGVLEQ